MSVAPKPFLFDTDFDVPGDDSRPKVPKAVEVTEPPVVTEPPAPTFSEAELAAAKAEAFQQGLDQASQQIAGSMEAEVHTLIRAVATNLTELSAVQERENAERTREAIAVAKAICQKLIPDMVERNGVNEVERAVREAVRELNEPPRILLTVAPALRGPLADRLDGIVAGAGYDGRIEIHEDPSLDHGDCVMSWGEGGGERRLSDLWQKVSSVIDEGVGEAAAAFDRAQAHAAAEMEAKAKAAAEHSAEQAAALADSPESNQGDPVPSASDEPEPTQAAIDESPDTHGDEQSITKPSQAADSPQAPSQREPDILDGLDQELENQRTIDEPQSPPSAPARTTPPMATDAPLHAKTVQRAKISDEPLPAQTATETAASKPSQKAPIVKPKAGGSASVNALGIEIDEDSEEGGFVDDALDRALGTLSGERKPDAKASKAGPPKMGAIQNSLGIEIDEDAEEGGFVDDALDRALGNLSDKSKHRTEF